MGRLARWESERVADIVHELSALRAGDSGVTAVIEPVRELLATESVWTYRPVATLGAWDVEALAASGISTDVLTRFSDVLRGITGEFAWFRPSAPEPAQRNRVVDALAEVRRQRPGFFEESALYQQFFRVVGLHEHHQLRVLLCDGPRLLAWFGAYQPESPTRRQFALLAALVPALQRRLRLEQLLSREPTTTAAIAAAIEAIARPACVLDRRGRIEAANHSARLALRRDPDALCKAERISIIDGTGSALALLHTRRPLDVEEVAARWQLTPRQTEVLALIACGHSNAAISTQLGISVRAVELQVTALLARTQVENRIELIAKLAAQRG